MYIVLMYCIPVALFSSLLCSQWIFITAQLFLCVGGPCKYLPRPPTLNNCSEANQWNVHPVCHIIQLASSHIPTSQGDEVRQEVISGAHLVVWRVGHCKLWTWNTHWKLRSCMYYRSCIYRSTRSHVMRYMFSKEWQLYEYGYTPACPIILLV